MNTRLLISIFSSIIFVAFAFWTVSGNTNSDSGTAAADAVSVVHGTQIIDIAAKGGYAPRVVEAKAGMPTVLRVTTKGTFDCSTSLVIPKLSYQKSLQPSGVEEIAISAEEAKGILQGTCSMGMYGFQIKFLD